MGLSEEIRRQLVESFKVEQAEHVQKITQGLLALEKKPRGKRRQALLEEIFREAHSLKGSARAVGMATIDGLSHALESLLLDAKEGRLTFSPELFDLLYQSLDAVEATLDRVEAGEVAPSAEVLALLARLEEVSARVKAGGWETMAAKAIETPYEPGPEEEVEPESGDEPDSMASQRPVAAGEETIRVSISKLDALMAQFSELLGAKIRAEQRLAEVRQMQTMAANWNKEWLALRGSHSRLSRNGHNGHNKDVEALIAFTDKNQAQLRSLMAQTNTLYRQFGNDNLRLSLIVDELQEEIKRVRMLPLATITASFHRMVRDLARQQGKEITLVITGNETELDKRVLEQVKDPLIHLLRNAVDHGIETAEERQQAGKPAEGQIHLAASQQGNNMVVTVSDDGRGLDLPAIRQTAARRGLMSLSEARKLTDADAAALIFSSGLSTSKIITDISGRGVGLDVVRQNVEELHGTLDVSSQPGQGTTFTLTLPLTLASSRGLMVRAGSQTFILPHSTVERMLQVKRSDVASVEGREAIIYRGKPVALAWLEDLLELPASPRDGERLTLVVVSVAEKRLALVVDTLEGEQEIVMTSLGKQLAKVGGIAGATVLGSGRVILVLHVADLIKLANRTRSRTPFVTEARLEESQRRRTILVVDDSITTRTLEKNILEAAGYQVRLASDGEEAYATLIAGDAPDLIVSDLNMPRLDGFELTGRIKQDKRYADIPVILVTSLDSPADKARGIEVGADAYIVKSDFDQGNLLETIEQLIL
ncbi:MAG: hybrid sensor histidine kinase/response regulator [Chloroflexi bacterium]|nr:hybrid sensor histidine kinase/response regulator [Chloroflexota bacterium]MCI0575182.1 hybrid sensor histidine kinase/response regulator [Chloroflexota bacterium]MCI0647136.1 hybrid sensor histidine kinase/response regulator [Chloroflexota bacterium]MCI0729988.1 hybrid sensor histidine kinase/response regulator [Chloroflexota bacterium]